MLSGGIQSFTLLNHEFSTLKKKGRVRVTQIVENPPPKCNHEFIGMDDSPSKFWEIPPKKGSGFCCKVCGNGLVDRESGILSGVKHPWASAKNPTVLVAKDQAGDASIRCYVKGLKLVLLEDRIFAWNIDLVKF